MKSLKTLPALLALAAFTACGDADETETVVETTPVVETPAPVYEEPVATEVVTPVEERAAEPARPAVMMGENGTPLMSDEMRYRNMDRGYTAEDFERMGVAIEDDMYGGDRY